jgi:hypothetical protein
MTENLNGGMPDPNSEEGKALAELAKEGEFVAGKEPEKSEPVKEEPAKVEEKKVEVTTEPKKTEEIKPNRPVMMVETWKLKVAEDQKAKLESELTDLKAKLEEIGKKGPATETQKDDIQAEIKAIADEAGIDPAPLTKLADSILKRAKPSEQMSETVKKIEEEREIAHQENLYSQEFEKDVTPIIKAEFPTLPDSAITDIKSKLKDLAFTETYAKVPLADIFRAKRETLDIQVPKRSSEGKGVKARATDAIVDLENLSEEEFNNLPPEKAEALIASRSGGGWKRP